MDRADRLSSTRFRRRGNLYSSLRFYEISAKHSKVPDSSARFPSSVQSKTQNPRLLREKRVTLENRCSFTSGFIESNSRNPVIFYGVYFTFYYAKFNIKPYHFYEQHGLYFKNR